MNLDYLKVCKPVVSWKEFMVMEVIRLMVT